jgi:cellulose synthase/poly-beta-1,6-N-acetylglucosamine synthase-like glycosyltransferase
MDLPLHVYRSVLDAINTLEVNDKETIYQLLSEQNISPGQLEDALAIHIEHRTPMLDILGSMGYVNPKDYAAQLAQVNNTGYISDLVGSEFLDYDADFVQRFNPADLIRYLFCPLRQLDDSTVIVLAVNPNEAALTSIVQKVVPNAELLVMVGTEVNVTQLVNSLFQEPLLHHAINHLREQRPEESASRVFTRPQLIVGAIIALGIIAGLLLNPTATMVAFIVVMSIVYAISIFYKLALSLASQSRTGDSLLVEHANALVGAELPIYSILVPVYKEPEVVPRLLKALSRIDYPREKLDVLLLMEEDDLETIAKAREAAPPSFFRFIIVPESLPRTKPKACNYGLHFCRGKYVTIYDAEDIPEPDQLRKAVAAFEKGGESLICVQAALNYFNAEENYLTRMFTLEYTYWFDSLLPGLDRLKLPIPLGGTSNHFRLDKLQELGAWDPYNVTEDADLGVRASCNGYKVGVIRSTTYEEANKAYRNWIRQRSRWIKGYMQTWLVHNRNPLHLLRSVGLRDWLSYNLFIGGTVAVFLINPIMWGLFLLWALFHPAWMGQLFTGWVWIIAVFSLIVGNGTAIILNIMGIFKRKNYRLLLYALTNPFYWSMHSVAAYIALWQLITKPFYWEKTNHGLTTVNTEALFEKTGTA